MTACRAVLELEKNQTLEGGFQLLIGLSEIHVPRMWVEEHPDNEDSQVISQLSPPVGSHMNSDTYLC